MMLRRRQDKRFQVYAGTDVEEESHDGRRPNRECPTASGLDPKILARGSSSVDILLWSENSSTPVTGWPILKRPSRFIKTCLVCRKPAGQLHRAARSWYF